MMTAAAALEKRHGHDRRPRSRTSGTLRLDDGQTKIDDADRKGDGLDDVRGRRRLLAQRRRRQGRPRARQDDRASRPRSSTTCGCGSATARRPASTSPARSAASSATRRSRPWRQIDLANGVVRPGRGGHPDPARDGLRGADERRALRPAARRPGGRRPRRHRSPQAAEVIDAGPVDDAGRDDAPRHHRGARSTATGRSSRATTSAARPAPPRSGTRRPTTAAAPGSTTCSTTRSSATSAGRPAVPDLVVAIRIEEGTPTVARVGHLEMPVMSFELFRRIATDAITTPDLLPDRPTDPTRADRGPVTAGYATLAPVTDVDPSTPARRAGPGEPALTADDLVRLTGGRLLARSDRPIRGAAVDSRAGRSPASCSSPCPASGPTATPSWPSAIARGAAALIVARPVDGPGRARRRHRRPRRRPAGRARGDRRRLAAPVRPARRRRHREHRQDVDQGGRRGGPRRALPDPRATRATRTTRSACR